MLKSKSLSGACLTALLLSACTTTAGSSSSTAGGIFSNFKPTYKSLSSSYYDTLNMETIAENHITVTEEDLVKLAVNADLSDAKGFIGVAHASSYLETGESHNLVLEEGLTGPINLMKDNLLAAWDGPAPDIQVFISSQDSYHGRAYKENFIILPIGALMNIADERTEIEGEENKVGSEGELAAFMAHEMAHILLGHYKRGVEKELKDRLNTSAAQISTVGAVIAGVDVSTSGGQVNFRLENEAKTTDVVQKVLLTKAILSETNNLLSASASREQEDHADLLAADLLARSGYEVSNVSDFLDRSRQAQKTAAERLSQMSDDRKLLLGTVAQQAGFGQKSGWAGLGIDLGIAIGTQMLNSFLDNASSTHRTTEKRMNFISEYESLWVNRVIETDEESPESVGALDKSETWDAYHKLFNEGASSQDGEIIGALRSDEVKELFGAYRLAFEAKRLKNTPVPPIESFLAGTSEAEIRAAAAARQAAINEQNAEISNLIEEALAKRPDEPEILLIAADHFLSQRNTSRATALLEAAAEQEGTGPFVYVKLADAYFAGRRFDDMLATIETGKEAIQTEIPFYPVQIGYLAHQKDWDGARALFAKCEETKAENYIEKCNETMEPVRIEEARQRANAQQNLKFPWSN